MNKEEIIENITKLTFRENTEFIQIQKHKHEVKNRHEF